MCVVVMAMVGWMGAGIELVVGMDAGQSLVVGRIKGDSGAFPECVGNTLITPDRTTIQVRSSGWGRVGICRTSRKGLNTGRHERTPVRCPCSRLAALHGAPLQCEISAKNMCSKKSL